VRTGLFFIFAILMLLVAPSHASAAQREGGYADITVDRSSPEKHLATFLTAVDRVVLRMEAREWARSFYDAWFYADVPAQQAAEMELLKKDVLDSMDLSALPEWRRESAGLETAFMLREILAAENVDKNAAFRQLRDGLWTIPAPTYRSAPSAPACAWATWCSPPTWWRACPLSMMPSSARGKRKRSAPIAI
jgi:hypothetical protein